MTTTKKSRPSRDANLKQLKKDGVYISDASPTTNLLFVLQNTVYSYYKAICDIVDNSFDADADNVYIELGTKNSSAYIKIGDDGTAMSGIVMGEALKLANKDENLPTKSTNTLGKYHIGLNSSILSLEGKSALYSKEHNKELHRGYFIKEDLEKSNWEIPIYSERSGEISDEEINDFNEFLKNPKSGTLVHIWDINATYSTDRQNVLKKTLGRVYREYLLADKNIYVNGSIVTPLDPMMYRIPAKTKKANGKKQTLKSEKLKTIEFDKIEYTDRYGVKHKNGYLKYTSYCLPITGKEDSKDLGINIPNSGIYVMRNGREIEYGKTFGIYIKSHFRNKYRATLEFSDELDSELKVDFTKTNIQLSQAIIDKIRGPVDQDIRTSEKRVKDARAAKANAPTSETLEKTEDKLSRHLKRKAALLKRIKQKQKAKTDPKKPVKPRDPNKPKRPYKKREASDKWVIVKTDQLSPRDSAITGEMIDWQKELIELTVNTKHKLYTDFLMHLPEEGITPIYMIYYSLFRAREMNMPNEEHDRNQLVSVFEQVDAEVGMSLDTLLQDAPGTKN